MNSTTYHKTYGPVSLCGLPVVVWQPPPQVSFLSWVSYTPPRPASREW